jgi:TonB family protein
LKGPALPVIIIIITGRRIPNEMRQPIGAIPRRLGPAARAICGIVAGAVALATSPAPPPNWERLLALPLSPGSVALLAEHAADPRVVARWAEALKDPSAEVRAAAARAFNVMGMRGQAPSLSAALAAETDPSAAAEQAEALAALGAPPRDAELLAAAQRDARFAPAVAMALARSRGASALAHAGLVSDDRWALREFVALATRREAPALTTLAAGAIREGNVALATAAFEAAADAGLILEDAVLSAFAAPAAEMRVPAYWHVTLGEAKPSPRIAAAIETVPEATGRSEHAPARLALEMLRRRLGRPRKEDAQWVTALGDPGPEGVPHELGDDREALKRLTRAELAALSGHLRHDPGALHEELQNRPRAPRGTPDTSRPALRTPDGYPRGLIGDLMRVSGCAPGQDSTFHGGEVVYGTDGRPRRVSLLPPGHVKPECVTALKALLLLRLAGADSVSANGHTESLIQPLVPAVVGCLQEVEPSDTRPPRPVGGRPERQGRGRIKEPKKLRNVAPNYPDSAKSSRVQGTVVLRAVIGASGCVRSVAVLRQVHPALDLSALYAVSQWRYTPTLLDGVPVPVIMTVTVNYRLN